MNKKLLIDVISELPDDASVDDLIERLLFVKSIEDGIKEFENGVYVPQSDIENMVEEWRKLYGR